MKQMKTLEKLLKDELSATETYQQALDKIREDVAMGEADELMPIFEAHKEAACSLQDLTTRLGGTSAVDSGAWGAWAKLVLGGANMLGMKAVLKALHEGEKSGESDYKEALLDAELPSDLRSLIETKLLSAQKSHIETLDRLLAATA
ncbi:MAG: DUF2383 domain-containing protein [Methylovulum sp.]|nr:DUF2383 domain-containing protein [Methylovulum sp.]